MTTLKSRAQQIKTETTKGANTANRVGGLLEDIADAIALIDSRVSALEGASPPVTPPITITSLTADGNIITCIATGGEGTLTYTLYFDDAEIDSNTTGIFEVTAAGTYTVTVTDSKGNTAATGTVNVEIPTAEDAMFWLDGTIEDFEGTKYFVDKSGNDRNFVINDYDFNDDWNKGFPYKSAATISAPADDAALIAADINNFLYDADGDPNQIPVVSLFQDVDFEHKLFSRHAAQVVDGNGVETYEPRVLDVVLYSAAKADQELTDCQTYFGVPAEDANAKWVSKAGNDTTGDGTKQAPYLTMMKAYKTLPNNSVIYVKSGTYAEEYNTTSIRCFYADRAITLTINGLGYIKMITVSTDFVVRAVAGVVNWSRIIFDGEGNTGNIHDSFSGGNNEMNYSNCLMHRSSSTTIRTAVNANVNVVNLFNSVINGAVTLVDASTVSGCLRNGVTFNNGGIITYNKINILTFHSNGAVIAAGYVAFNKFKVSRNAIVNTSVNAEVCYNDIEYVYDAVNTSGTLQIVSMESNVPNIHHNHIYSNSVDVGHVVSLIRIDGTCSTPSVNNNVLYSKSTTNINLLTIALTSNVMGKVTCNNNRFHSNLIGSSIAVEIGGETTQSQKINGSEFIGNHIIGSLLENPNTNPNGQHLSLFSGGINFDVKYNIFSYGFYGLVIKTGAANQKYTSGGVYYNLFLNNVVDLYGRGIQSLKVYNNSHYCKSDLAGGTPSNRIIFDRNNTTDQYSEDVLIKNCIINSDYNTTIPLVRFDTHAAANGCKLSNSIISTANASNVLLNDGTSNYTSVAAISAAGYGDDNIDADPLYSDYNKLTIASSSPAIDAGIDNGEDYDTGLDPSTNWGSDTELPVIVTKQQGAEWDIGAYVI
jgi:hypothetical protein